MCEAVTFNMFVSVIVQSIEVVLSTNVTTPVPVVVLAGTSLAGDRLATYCFGPGAVEDPQLATTKAIVAAEAIPARVPTVLRILPPGERRVEARNARRIRKPERADDRGSTASSASFTAVAGVQAG
jgi:hypothetical protein